MHQGNSNMGTLVILTDCSAKLEQGIKVEGKSSIYRMPGNPTSDPSHTSYSHSDLFPATKCTYLYTRLFHLNIRNVIINSSVPRANDLHISSITYTALTSLFTLLTDKKQKVSRNKYNKDKQPNFNYELSH
jgi:hypothetical protein